MADHLLDYMSYKDIARASGLSGKMGVVDTKCPLYTVRRSLAAMLSYEKQSFYPIPPNIDEYEFRNTLYTSENPYSTAVLEAHHIFLRE